MLIFCHQSRVMWLGLKRHRHTFLSVQEIASNRAYIGISASIWFVPNTLTAEDFDGVEYD